MHQYEVQVRRAASTSQPHDDVAIALRRNRPPVQAKLSVGPSGDRYEQEADLVAAEVVRSIRSTPAPTIRPSTTRVQPASATPASSVTTSRPSTTRVQPMSAAPAAGLAGGDLDATFESHVDGARSRGRGLDGPIRASMEHSFGVDFGAVRIHHDSQATQLNRKIQARAFTTGSDVFFSAGEYNPGSADGQQLLAHELTHVVQQGGAREVSPNSKVQRSPVASARKISRMPVDAVQRKAVPGLTSLSRPTGVWTDTGNGVFGFDTPTDADDVVALVTAIRSATADTPMRIKVLTGVHGSEPDGHLVGTDTIDPAQFYAEDLTEEGHAGLGGWTNVLNVRNKNKDQLTNWINASSSVVILAWCYSAETVAHWATIAADWEDGTKGTGFAQW
jgi:hypothetical protein